MATSDTASYSIICSRTCQKRKEKQKVTAKRPMNKRKYTNADIVCGDWSHRFHDNVFLKLSIDAVC